MDSGEISLTIFSLTVAGCKNARKLPERISKTNNENPMFFSPFIKLEILSKFIIIPEI
jgi:hypothetical protein